MTIYRYNFNGGEVAPEMLYRPELAKYATSCSLVNNFELTAYGALKRRGGIRLVRFLAGLGGAGAALGGTYTGIRILPFVAGANNRFAVALLTSADRCDFVSVDVDTGDTLWSTVGEASAPATYTATEIQQIQYCHANDVMYLAHANHPLARIARDDDGWSIADAAVNGGPWLDDYLGQPTLTLSDSVTDWTTAGSPTYNVDDIRRANGKRWRCTVMHGATVNREPGAGITYLDYWEQELDYEDFDLVASDDLFTSEWVGTRLRLRFDSNEDHTASWGNTSQAAFDEADPDGTIASILGPYPCSHLTQFRTRGSWRGKVALDVSSDNWATHDTIFVGSSFAGDLRNYDIERETMGYGAQIRARVHEAIVTAASNFCNAEIVMQGTTYAYVEITAVTDAQNAVVKRLDYRQDEFESDVWNEGHFSPRNGYPGSVVIHGERLWLGGATRRPQTLHASRLNDWADWAFGEDEGAPLSITFQTDNRNAIRWLASGKALVAGTDLSNFLVTPRDGTAGIGPGNIEVTREDAHGSASIRPVWGGDTLFYVQSGADQIRALYYEFARDSYQSDEVTMLARHLVEDGIADIAGGQERLYARTTAGELLVYTYDRKQEISGWTRFTPADGLSVLSVATVVGPTRPDIAMVLQDVQDRCWLAIMDEDPSHYVDYVSGIELTTSRAVQVVQETFRPADTANDAYADDDGDAVTLIEDALVLLTTTEATTWRLYSATEPTITPHMRTLNTYEGGAADSSGVTRSGTLLVTTELTKAQYTSGSYALQYDDGGWTNAASVEAEDLSGCTFAIADPGTAFNITPSCPLGDGYLILDTGLISVTHLLYNPVKLLPLGAGAYTIKNTTDHAYLSEAMPSTLNWGDGTLGKRSRSNRLSLYLVDSEGGSVDIGEANNVQTLALPSGNLNGEQELSANSGFIDRLYLRIHTSANAAFRLAALGVDLQRYER